MQDYLGTLLEWENATEDQQSAVRLKLLEILNSHVSNAALLLLKAREVKLQLSVMRKPNDETLGFRVTIFENEEAVNQEWSDHAMIDSSLFSIDIGSDCTVLRIIEHKLVERGIIQRQCQLQPLPANHPLARARGLYHPRHTISSDDGDHGDDDDHDHENDDDDEKKRENNNNLQLFYKRQPLLDYQHYHAYILGFRQPYSHWTLYLTAAYLTSSPPPTPTASDDKKDEVDVKTVNVNENAATMAGAAAYHWKVTNVANALACRIAEDGSVETFCSADGVTRTVVWQHDDTSLTSKLWPIQPCWAKQASEWRRVLPPVAGRADFKALARHIQWAADLPHFTMDSMLKESMRQLHELQESKENRAAINLAYKILDTHGEELIDSLPWEGDTGIPTYGAFIRYNLACYHAVLEETLVALVALEDAIVKAGYCDFEWMRKDEDLRSLRNLSKFQSLFPSNDLKDMS